MYKTLMVAFTVLAAVSARAENTDEVVKKEKSALFHDETKEISSDDTKTK